MAEGRPELARVDPLSCYPGCVSDAIEDKHLMTPKVLWGSFLMTQLVFAGVGYMTSGQSLSEVQGDLAPWIIAGVGTVIGLASFFVVPTLARSLIASQRKANPKAKPMALVFTPFILGMAMREAAAILALVALFLSGDLLMWLAPAGLAFASTALAAPSREQFEGWLKA